MKVSRGQCLILVVISLFLSACNSPKKAELNNVHQVTVTTLQPTSVTVTEQYVCQIRSHHHVKIGALATGYLDAVKVAAGQHVKRDDLLFVVNYKSIFDDKVVTAQDEAIPSTSEVDKAKADAEVAAVMLRIGDVKAPFDGIVDRIYHPQGSLVQKGDTLATLSDNTQMWVYFNIPEARYLEHQNANRDHHKEDLKIELVLANGKKFDQLGKFGAIGADFNAETGNIQFRADFPNPKGLLRHGQSGKVLISRVQDGVIAVPARATFELGHKRYVYVVDNDDLVRRREIKIENEVDDLFVIKAGVGAGDKIVVTGSDLVYDGDQVEYEDNQPQEAAAKLKNSPE